MSTGRPLSDSHGYLDDAIFSYFAECDELWHAGDFGPVDVLDSFSRGCDALCWGWRVAPSPWLLSPGTRNPDKHGRFSVSGLA